jgi:hypothetical protein
MADLADILALIISVLALGASFLAFMVARRGERRSLFIQLQESLTSLDAQEGRRLLYDQIRNAEDPEQLRDADVEMHDKINRALGQLNTLGMYAYRHDVDRDIVREAWADPLGGIWPAAEIWLRYRRRDYATAWSYLVWFARDCGLDVSPDLATVSGPTARRPRVR